MTSIFWWIGRLSHRPTSARIGPYLDEVEESFILDPHVLDGIEECYSLGEPTLHFQHTLPNGLSRLVLSQVFWQEYSNMTDCLNCRQQNWDHERIAFDVGRARQNATRCWCRDISVFGKSSPRLTTQKNVEDVLFVWRDVIDLEF